MPQTNQSCEAWVSPGVTLKCLPMTGDDLPVADHCGAAKDGVHPKWWSVMKVCHTDLIPHVPQFPTKKHVHLHYIRKHKHAEGRITVKPCLLYTFVLRSWLSGRSYLQQLLHGYKTKCWCWSLRGGGKCWYTTLSLISKVLFLQIAANKLLLAETLSTS